MVSPPDVCGAYQTSLSSFLLCDLLMLVSVGTCLTLPPGHQVGATLTSPLLPRSELRNVHPSVGSPRLGAQTRSSRASQRAGVVREGSTERGASAEQDRSQLGLSRISPRQRHGTGILSCDNDMEAGVWRLVSGTEWFKSSDRWRLVARELGCLGLQVTENQARTGLYLKKMYYLTELGAQKQDSRHSRMQVQVLSNFSWFCASLCTLFSG